MTRGIAVMKPFAFALFAAALLMGGAQARTAADDELAWVTDQDDHFFYLAYTIPESDRFAVAFACDPKDKRTYIALHEKQDGPVKTGDKFPLTLQIGDVKVVVQAETTFDAGEEMLRSIAPLEDKSAIFQALTGKDPLQVTRAGETATYPLTDIVDRLEEFRQGCGLKK